MAAIEVLTGTSEVIVSIFGECETFRDAAAFSSTCKFLNSVWHVNSSSILQSIGQTNARAFEQALMAVHISLLPLPVIVVLTVL